jgi:type II secretory pathway component GspD/PulD (secretin)
MKTSRLFALTSLAVTLVAASAFGQQPSNPAGSPALSPAPILPPPTIAQNPAPPPIGETPAPAQGTNPATTAPAPIEPPTLGTPGVPSTDPSLSAAGSRAREFEGTELGTVLRLLARQAKINLIISDKVLATPSTVTIRLEDKTALDTIKIIAQQKGLLFTQVEGDYFVKDPSERAAEPTESDFYTFSYASAAKSLPLVEGQLGARIKPQIDERTNTIYYSEFKSNIDKIRLFMRQIDKPTRQVMIEARLVEVNANPKQSYGINWGGVVGSSTQPQTFRYGASLPRSPTTGLTTVGFTPTGGAQLNDFVQSGAPNNFLGNIASQLTILSIPQMSATLRLLNEDSDAEFLANPRIVTANNLEATIKIVRKQPVPRLNFNEQTATAVFSGFEDKVFGNTLIVRPTINKDNFITMSVKPEISNKVGDQTFIFGGASVSSPIIDTRSLESNVLIKSGCTLAVGGLLQDEVGKQRTKVPVLGDIPILGYLFQEHLNARTKRNLLIFITPTIIAQPYGTGLEDQVTGLKNSSNNEFADPIGWRNNARGSIRLVPTSNRQVFSDYPKPGTQCDPADTKSAVDAKSVDYRDNASSRSR